MQQLTPVNAHEALSEIGSIVENLLLLLTDKEKVVIKKRFNIAENRKYTLEEIGKEFSVTRERIRQIEKSALSKMRRNVFNTSLKYLHTFIMEILQETGGLLAEDDLMEALRERMQNVSAINENCVRLALELNDELDCVGNTISFSPYVKEKVIVSQSLKFVSDQIINQLNKIGDARKLDELQSDLKDVFSKANFNLLRAKSLVSIDKRLTIVDDEFVALLEWRHIHPRTLRDKIFYILRNEKKPLHFIYISDRIKSENFDNKVVNVQAVHNELIRHGNFVLVGRGIYALKEWGYESGTVSDVIKKVLAVNKEMEQEDIIDAVLKERQVKKITIVLALKNGKDFVRVGRKRYKLKK
ncbi:hypothetical protein KJ632_01630 [Patescibacteria group bacterium]|nr:hypothetical protein [Patescibacteria group bacterium]